ncbi:TIGR03016 family PEP-CTERM system-associated outer membrane protein [Rheinheimera sp.]|uniref:TIGR03016 family PEP-CTERM system-associated outer membrane protein n=1 Tax=Rheinheimera sp. TaxID=1869214 RepID=UPI00273696F5|nr:TIGR03016 family PEP-CTERM system-associated outer membrane protein [Rheinheimera sp.]MDP2715877.1 TIGR03016 family PEP-CTERM system-associated outer membrane protein [Rheinheimera sp.]
MAMVITMVPASVLKLSIVSRKVVAGIIAVPFITVSAIAAEVKISPELELGSYAFWLRDDQQSAGLDKGLAALVSPSLTVNATGSNLSSALYLQNESIWYKDAQRSHKSLAEYSWRNLATAYDKRVSFGVSANSSQRVRNSQNGVFSDIITGQENLSKTESYTADLGFKTLSTADVRAQLALSYRVLRSEAPELDDGEASFNNDAYTATLGLGSATRQSTLFWQANGNYSKTARDARGDFVSKSASGSAGVPVAPGLSLVGRGSYEYNDNTSSFNNEFRSYGVGLEYQFGRASRINVTQNRYTSGNNDSTQADTSGNYIGTEIFLAPSRRTTLSYNLDRRYFGRTANLQASYNLRYLSFRLTASDSVQTLSSLDEVFEDLGIFVCPDGAAQINECFRPPTNNYELGTGESFRQLFDVEFEISEEIIQRRSAAMTVGYSKNRLALSVQASKSEDDYVESARFNERSTFSMQASWQLSQHSGLLLNARHYEIDYGSEQRRDANISVELGVNHKLNTNAGISASVRRLVRNSTLDSFDIEENRIWLTYNHKF